MPVRLIGIAGPSGSGKSELASRISTATQAPIVSLDDELLLSHCAALARGEAVDVPHYDFATHTRVPGGERIEPGETVIVEGLFTLFWKDLRRLLHAGVYVELEDETCFARRQARDIRERGRTPECIERQYASTVRPMAEQYIWPTRRHADIVVRGDALLEESVAAVLAYANSLPISSPVSGSW